MLVLNEQFLGTAVLSLRVGGLIGHITEPVINPNNLFIEAWRVIDSHSKEPLLLLTKDIRDIIPKGIVIDDHEVLTKEDELVRLKDILEINFKLPGLKVQSESGRNYGKVADFAFETSSFFIKKIYANQSLVKSFSGGSISINRTQVLEITDRRIIISDPTEKAGARSPATSPIAN